VTIVSQELFNMLLCAKAKVMLCDGGPITVFNSVYATSLLFLLPRPPATSSELVDALIFIAALHDTERLESRMKPDVMAEIEQAFNLPAGPSSPSWPTCSDVDVTSRRSPGLR
jgi:hypothetical protein